MFSPKSMSNLGRLTVTIKKEKFQNRSQKNSHACVPLSPAMGARNQVGIGLLYRPASLCS